MNLPRTLPPGTRIGPYTLTEPLGYGATAVVYRGYDDEGRTRAIKIRRGGVRTLDRRMVREFEAMRALRLPGVVRVHDAGFDEELLWFSMDLVEGPSFVDHVQGVAGLHDRVRRTMDLGRQLFDVLDGLHSTGLVHRDIKPSNVLIDPKGQLQVLDFGIARLFGPTDDPTSENGQVVGTLPFMAPEQVAGLRFDHRIDLYAAGLLLYEAIAGPRPRPATAAGWITRICLESPPPLAGRFREVPQELSALIEVLLQIDPESRGTAREAAHRLRRLLAGKASHGASPEPAWVDPGPAWSALDDCLAPPQGAAFRILLGPAGSGKRRWAEQLHRQAVLQGVPTYRVHCQRTRVGQPLAQLLTQLAVDESSPVEPLFGDEAPLLARVWPHLLSADAPPSTAPLRVREAADAIARVVQRANARRGLLVLVESADQIDALTAVTLEMLAQRNPKQLGVLVLADPRWLPEATRGFFTRLEEHGALSTAIPLLSAEHASAIARSLCPNGTLPAGKRCTPLEAVEVGLRALALWRGEAFSPPAATLRHLAVTDRPVPEEAYTALGGRLDDAWTVCHDGEVTITGRFAKTVAATHIRDPAPAARALETTWREITDSDIESGALADLRLRSGDFVGAWEPVVLAALRAERTGRFAEAHEWLMLLDLLPPQPDRPRTLRFEVARMRAELALRTGAAPYPAGLLDICDALAETDEQRQRLRVLAAEVRLHEGEARTALVAALRAASTSHATDSAIRALAVATDARLVLGQLDEARKQLDRAQALHDAAEGRVDRRLSVLRASQEAEILFRRGELQACRQRLQHTLRAAAEARFVRGGAIAAARLGQVLRLLGKRREAEHQVRTARDAFLDTSDLRLAAESTLHLAVLRAERGDAVGARYLLADALRRMRGGSAAARLEAARIGLTIAVLRADPSEGAAHLPHIDASRDPESAAVLVRWWRCRNDRIAAFAVLEPRPGYASALWRVERARAFLQFDDPNATLLEARSAEIEAIQGGFSEIELHARLVRGVLQSDDEAEWRELQRRAADSLSTELYLGALELDARRLERQGQHHAARSRWVTLLRRAEEVGHQPSIAAATLRTAQPD